MANLGVIPKGSLTSVRVAKTFLIAEHVADLIVPQTRLTPFTTCLCVMELFEDPRLDCTPLLLFACLSYSGS